MADALHSGVAGFAQLIRDLEQQVYRDYQGLDDQQAQHDCGDYIALDALVLRSVTAHLQAPDEEQRRGYLRALVYVLSNLAIDGVPPIKSPRFSDQVLETMPSAQGWGNV